MSLRHNVCFRKGHTFRAKKRSGLDVSVTLMAVPLGATSSKVCTVSMVKPYWFVSQE